MNDSYPAPERDPVLQPDAVIGVPLAPESSVDFPRGDNEPGDPPHIIRGYN